MKKIDLLYYIIPAPIISSLIKLFYWSSLHYPFQFDDNPSILKQFAIRKTDLHDYLFSHTRWVGLWINSLNFKWGGFDPFYFRVTNMAIHISASILVFYALFFMLRMLHKKSFFFSYAYPISLLASLLFALHPVQTQTVSYVIQGRFEGLATLFIMATTISFLAYNYARSHSARIASISLLFTFSLLAYGSKEISIVTPILLILVDWFFVAQGSWQSLKKRMLIHMSTIATALGTFWYFKQQLLEQSAALGGQLYCGTGNIITQSPYEPITAMPYLCSQFGAILHYIWMFVWPFNISVDYDWKLIYDPASIECLLPLIALLCIGAGIIALLRKNHTSITAFGALWFLIAIAPRSSIIPSAELIVDYKTYLASVGMFLLLSVGIIKTILITNQYLKTNRAYISYSIYSVIAIIALLLGTATNLRNHVWESELAFWYDIIDKAPLKARAYNNYGIALIKNKQYYDAIKYLKHALRLQPHNYWDPYRNLTVAYDEIGQTDKALAAIKNAIAINKSDPEAYNSLGLLFEKKNRMHDAEKSYQAAIALRKHYGKAWYNLSMLYRQQQKYDQAWDCARTCCTKADFDTDPRGFEQYAQLSMHLEKYDHAVNAYRKLLSMHPNHRASMLDLANAYLFNGNTQLALQELMAMANHYPTDIRPLSNAAQIYLSNDQPKEALTLLKKAKTFPNAPPVIDLKIARCYIALGQINEAVPLLNNLVYQAQSPKLRAKAQKLLAQIK